MERELKINTQVTITDKHKQYLKKHGNGSASEGIRVMIAAHKELERRKAALDQWAMKIEQNEDKEQ